MTPTCYSLFVYGSLRRGFQHPAFKYIHDHFEFAGDAKVKGILYDLGDFPAAIPTKDEKFITGELYSIRNVDEFSWTIAQLDDYEGTEPESGDKAMYRRELATIYINSKPTMAWIYWFNDDVAGKPVIHSGDVLQYYRDKK
jgi:gamma-glutamylcyclotransferase (GGCT)/AIG2-like uncharacterized protein YtfP